MDIPEENLPVNDGGGLYDNIGLIDSLIIDCNAVTNALMTGRCVQFCALIVGMVQKLSRLQEGVKNDMESRDNIIKDQRVMIKNLLSEINQRTEEDAS